MKEHLESIKELCGKAILAEDKDDLIKYLNLMWDEMEILISEHCVAKNYRRKNNVET